MTQNHKRFSQSRNDVVSVGKGFIQCQFRLPALSRTQRRG
jgi:hypothetical protein